MCIKCVSRRNNELEPSLRLKLVTILFVNKQTKSITFSRRNFKEVASTSATGNLVKWTGARAVYICTKI